MARLEELPASGRSRRHEREAFGTSSKVAGTAAAVGADATSSNEDKIGVEKMKREKRSKKYMKRIGRHNKREERKSRASVAHARSTATTVPGRARRTGDYEYGGEAYATKAALVVGFLDYHKVFTGKVRPPSVAEFVEQTGVPAGHGMYGARLHEYCHTPRTDKDGTYVIDRRALRAGKDGRVFVKAETAASGGVRKAA